MVPSPATSDVLRRDFLDELSAHVLVLALELDSFATVTPSLVTVGLPKDFSMMTLRPRGPSVTLTARASLA